MPLKVSLVLLWVSPLVVVWLVCVLWFYQDQNTHSTYGAPTPKRLVVSSSQGKGEREVGEVRVSWDHSFVLAADIQVTTSTAALVGVLRCRSRLWVAEFGEVTMSANGFGSFWADVSFLQESRPRLGRWVECWGYSLPGGEVTPP